VFNSVAKRVDSGARIFAGHQLKAKSIQNLLIFPDFIFLLFQGISTGLIKVATNSVFGTDFLGHCKCIWMYIYLFIIILPLMVIFSLIPVLVQR